MLSGKDLYNSQLFRDELNKCKIFTLKYPRGGQYNDGHELLGSISTKNGSELLLLLDTLGVPYKAHTREPDGWCPPPVVVGDELVWLEYDKNFVCFGYKTYITVGTSDHSVEFNFNSTSWYDVILDDVKRAVCFERELESKGCITSVC